MADLREPTPEIRKAFADAYTNGATWQQIIKQFRDDGWHCSTTRIASALDEFKVKRRGTKPGATRHAEPKPPKAKHPKPKPRPKAKRKQAAARTAVEVATANTALQLSPAPQQRHELLCKATDQYVDLLDRLIDGIDSININVKNGTVQYTSSGSFMIGGRPR